MDDLGLKLCSFQAQLFEESSQYFHCSSLFFIKNYMHSDLARRLDGKNFIFESKDILSCFQELNINNAIKPNAVHYPNYVMSWVGYFYRYACYEYHLSSVRIYKIIQPKELFLLYEAYHSLDIDEAIKRAFEAKGLNVNHLVNPLEIAARIYLDTKL